MGAHTHTQTAGCLKLSQDLALVSPLSLFHSFFAHSLPFSSQIAAAFDVLQTTIAGASALFYDSNSSLAPVESALMIISCSISFSLFLVISKHVRFPLQGVFLYLKCLPVFMTFDLSRKHQKEHFSFVPRPCRFFSVC